MDTQHNNPKNKPTATTDETRMNPEEDIRDSPRDEERLQADRAVIDLPDVSDIPGQENISPAPLGEISDTTISSADEEGDGIFDDKKE